MKKILFFFNSSDNVVNFRIKLIQILAKKFSIIICIPEIKNNNILKVAEIKNVKIEIIKYNKKSLSVFENYLFFLNSYKLIKKINPDLLITFTIKPNIVISFANIFTNVQIINVVTGLGSTFLNNLLLKIFIINLYKLCFKKSNLVIFQNEDDKKYFLQNKIVNKNNSKVINGSGIDTSIYNYYDFPKIDDEINFLYAGRLIKDKGIIELLDSFKFINNSYNKINLIIAGEIDKNNPSAISLKIVKSYSSKNIKFIGYVENLNDLIIKSHCCILLSYREGLSNFLLQSASVGRPIITTNVPGCYELVDKNSNGFLCNPRDTHDAIKQIEKFLKKDFIKMKEMGKNSRNKIMDYYSIEVINEKYFNEISKLIL